MNYQVAFRTNNSVSKILCHKKTKNNKNTGIYQINCGECGMFYIGQTGRDFETRYNEHLPKNQNIKTLKSKFTLHLINESHAFKNFDSDVKILHICQKGYKMDVLEELEIYKNMTDNSSIILNDKSTLKYNCLFESLLNLINTNACYESSN